MTNLISVLCMPVGEPLNHEAWVWYNDLVGEKRCNLVDTWWQTGLYLVPGGPL